MWPGISSECVCLTPWVVGSSVGERRPWLGQEGKGSPSPSKSGHSSNPLGFLLNWLESVIPSGYLWSRISVVQPPDTGYPPALYSLLFPSSPPSGCWSANYCSGPARRNEPAPGGYFRAGMSQSSPARRVPLVPFSDIMYLPPRPGRTIHCRITTYISTCRHSSKYRVSPWGSALLHSRY